MSLTIEDIDAIFTPKFDILFEGQRKILEKLAQQKTEILEESSQMVGAAELRISERTSILMESKFDPKFNLLAEGQQIILEKLVPRSRVDEIDEELKFLKAVVRQMNEDLQLLKKAN